MLRATEQDIPADRPFHACLEPSVPIEENNESTILSAALHGGWTQHDIAEADHATDMVDRNLELGLLLDLDLEGLMVHMKIGTFRGDVEGIEQLMHPLPPRVLARRTNLSRVSWPDPARR